jgi:thiamine-phosphate pyrophosphorylase
LEEALSAGVDMVQLREPHLSTRDLFLLAESVESLAVKSNKNLLINDRADVAACLGCGVHLATRSLAASVVRSTFGSGMLIGASTHNIKEAVLAESGGADFIVFGPVFETESKKIFGPPVGIDALKTVAARLRIPVLALGGIKPTNFQDALDAGAAGIAAISLFTEAKDLNRVVRLIKGIHG